jgi:DhnA family fructose-bisphosphate aldolase class Ia
MGRQIFSSNEVAARVEALRMIVHEGHPASQAAELIEE